MVSTEKIFEAIERQVRKALPAIIVSPNFMETSETDYVWVRFKERRADEGFKLIRRAVSVDLQVILIPAANLAVLTSRLYEIADAFAQAFNGFLKVEDRAFTLYESSSSIFDGILTYSFNLEFADYVEGLEAAETFDKMQELYIKENQNGRTNRI